MPAAPIEYHTFGYNPDSRTITWERLEQKRLERLGISTKYSRHFNVTRKIRIDGESEMRFVDPSSLPPPATPPRSFESTAPPYIAATVQVGKKKNNTLAPFFTLSHKPTCGYYFSRNTAHNKLKIGIPPTNTVQWRTTHASS